MATLHITEEDLARDVHGFLEKAQQGIEVVITTGDKSIAMRLADPSRRTIPESIELLRAHYRELGHVPSPDPDFAKDVLEGIESHRDPIKAPEWD